MRPREGGFALVPALWVAVILAVVVGSVLQLGRGDARLTRAREQAAAREALLDGIVTGVIQRLRGPAATQPPVDGTPFAVTLDGLAARVAVLDEAGKVDLNQGRPDHLLLALMAAGQEAGAAAVMAERILGWRVDGASAEPYRAAGLAHGPRGGRFRSPAELRMVPGMTEPLLASLAPMVTVYSQTAVIDPVFSDSRLLEALLGGEPAAEAALRRRRAVALGLAEPGRGPGVVHGHAYTIMVTPEDRDAPARTAVIRLTGRAGDPVWVYRWR